MMRRDQEFVILLPVPSVSVLMPCYNAVETLPEALESLARQTLVDFEVLVVDDGSMDGSSDLLATAAARDERIRVLRQPHGGIISALNLGLAACRAAYVARMDADDRSHPERLTRQVGFLNAHPDVAVVGCRVASFPEGQVRQGFRIYLDWMNSLISDQDIRREMFVESPLAHPSVTFRKEAVVSAGGYQERGWAEDYDLWLRLYTDGARFAKLPEVLFEWREHPERLTRTDGRYSVENFLRAKACYLIQGPLVDRDAVIVWGAGMMGRRLSKQLSRLGARLAAFVDIDPRKIGRTRRGLPVLPADELPDFLSHFRRPVVLAAVGARGARQLIRKQLSALGLGEAIDWWAVA